VTAIRVRCQGCGAEVNFAECDRNLRCVTCVAVAAIGQDLQEYQRLWAKRARYARQHIALGGADRQLTRLSIRMSKRLHEHIRDVELATKTLNEQLECARQRADTAGGRILVPRSGQEILGSGVRA
jgi:hypothetical protein